MTQEIIMDVVQMELGDVFYYVLGLVALYMFSIGVVALTILRGTK